MEGWGGMSYRPRLCEQCAQPFRPPHSTSRFCSRECLSESRLAQSAVIREQRAALQHAVKALVAA